MRLIDADRLPLVLQEPHDRPMFFCVMKESLDYAETIDAVPVGFILKYLEHIKENERWNDVSNIKRLGIREMLEKWKEENERNDLSAK